MAEEESVRIQQAQEGVNVLDYIVEGLEAELALERELGVRLVECDRSLLAPLEAASPSPISAPAPAAQPRPEPISAQKTPQLDFVFLHDKPLTAGGVEMMAKIVAALGKTMSTAPVVVDGERPPAKAYIVLGSQALKKWFPGTKAAPGQWIAASDAPNVLVTYSPSYILRFTQVTPAVQKIKKDMWAAIKSVLNRVGA